MKILLLHVPAGSGHERAAMALQEALAEQAPGAQVKLVNVLDYADDFYRWCYTEGYLGVIRRQPWAWGLGFYGTDVRCLAPVIRKIHRGMNHLHAKGLIPFLLDEKPDAIAGTHFLPMEAAAFAKGRFGLSAKLVAAVTDLRSHLLWTSAGIDTYVVGSEEAGRDLERFGVAKERIKLLGIPVAPRFAKSHDKKALKESLGLKPSAATLLIGSGGAGVGPVTQLVELLEKVPDPLQLLVVTGNNAQLMEALRARKGKPSCAVKVYGFTEKMDELMEVSDLMISKPGGLTCAETAAKGLPLIMVAPIPGQESRNAKVLCAQGAGLWVKKLGQVPGTIGTLLKEPGRLAALRRRALAFGRPQAAFDAARLLT
ncbi:MAG: hypothetical protein HYS41_02875 [Candidatus Omnitrophica bacterium]|nr:hypothetical protein [Candidatus Omnitrophota bacterium]